MTTIIYCILLSLFLFCLPRLRPLAIIPIAAIYFTCYANLTLTGSLPIANLPFANNIALQAFVDGQDHDAIVQVNSLINQKNKSYFTAKLIELDNNHLNYSPELEMRWYKPTVVVQAGQKHRVKIRLKPVYGQANPGGFDRQKWRFSEHIAYRANIKAYLGEVAPKISLRAHFYQKVQSLSADLNNQGVILALSFADKTLISADKKELIKALAISHLFAISGLHIGLLFSFVYLLSHWLITRLLPNAYLGWYSWRLVNLIALSGAFFYAYLAGFSLPTQRAFLMLLIAVMVLSMKRKCGLFDLLSFTLFIILLWDPLAVLSVSLWLSFFAVAIILMILWRFPAINQAPKSEVKKRQFVALKSYLKLLLLIQLSLTLLMLPVQLFSFSAFSWLSPLVNLIAVPFFSLLVIPFILSGCLFSLFFAPLGVFCFSLADQLITLFFMFFSGFEGAYQIYSVNERMLMSLLFSLALVLFIVYFQARNNRKIALFFAVLVLLIQSISWWEKRHKDPAYWFVEVIDVGQGLAVLVRNQAQTLLYDTGPRYPSGFNTATTEIIPYLQILGISELDYLVISHSDIDHAGGFAVMVEQFMPEQVILGEALTDGEMDMVNPQFCRAGQKWQLGALSVAVLSPLTPGNNNNDNSCVLRISDGQFSLLLTGDIGKRQEKKLLKIDPAGLASNLMIAPHHGSKHSSSETFIKAVAPQWAVFSAGFMNHWRFPAEEVKRRYQKQSVKMVNTGESGFIRFKIGKGEIKMQTYREDLAAYWYHHSFNIQITSMGKLTD